MLLGVGMGRWLQGCVRMCVFVREGAHVCVTCYSCITDLPSRQYLFGTC